MWDTDVCAGKTPIHKIIENYKQIKAKIYYSLECMRAYIQAIVYQTKKPVLLAVISVHAKAGGLRI